MSASSNVQKLTCAGLWTDPNPHANQPDGAMDIADNVVFRRPGTWELRPGFKLLSSERGEFDGFATLDGMMAFGGDLIVQANTAEPFIQQHIANINFNDEFGNAIGCPHNAVRGVDAGETLYWCGTDAVRKLYIGESRTVQVGAPVPHLEVFGNAASGSDGAVQPESYVAYRAVLRIVYEDERTVTSGYTARSVVYNDHATDTVSPSIRIYLPAGFSTLAPTSKAFVRVYRSKNSSVYPPDELFLAYEKEITLSHVAVGTALITSSDETIDAELGEALYTNPSRGTFARNNALSPAAQDLQVYAGSMFAGRLTYPYRKQLRWLQTIVSGATGIGPRQTVCDVTNGSDELTNCVSLTGVQVGMMVSVEGAQVADHDAPLLVMDIVGDVVTLSQAITSATDTGLDVVFYDAVHIAIDGEVEVFPLATFKGVPGMFKSILIGEGSATMDEIEPPCTESERIRAFALSDLVRYTQGDRDPDWTVNVYLESIRADLAEPFTVAATHGDQMDPPLPLPTEDAEDWSEAERPYAEDSVAWTKTEELEHYLESGRRVIGTAGIPILRIFATVDALWILKARGDGIYRLTGQSERNGWYVEQASKTCALLHPYLACSDGTAVYAWTNEGAVRIGRGGVQPLSGGVVGKRWEKLQRTQHYDTERSGCFCVANSKSNEVLWGLPAIKVNNGGTGAARDVLVLNTLTGAWSTWFADAEQWCAACVSETTLVAEGTEDYGLIHLAPNTDDGFVSQERGAAREPFDPEEVERADQDYAITVASVDDEDVTIDSGSGWTMAVGDIVVQGAARYLVTAVAGGPGTTFTADRAGLSAGAATAYDAFDARLRWASEFGGGPDRTKVWTHMVAHFESTLGACDATFTMQAVPNAEQTHVPPLRETFLERLDDTDHEHPQDVRAQVNNDAANGTRLRVGLRIRSADSRIRGSGVSIKYRDAEKVGSARP